MNQDSFFSHFIYMQAQSAGLFLGLVAHPSTGEKKVQLAPARQVIATLAMLEEKTKGNLTDQEEKLLADALKNLRPLLAKVEEAQQKNREK